jgi:tetrahydrodipicolinate N-succinyltransferase
MVQINPDFHFETVLRDLQKLAQEQIHLTLNKSVPWFRPSTEDWDGNLNNQDKFTALFSRVKLDTQLLESFKEKEGNLKTGDMIAALKMLDTLSALERAYRMRHSSKIRRHGAYLSRQKGHGDELGFFINNNIEEIRKILTETRKQNDS